MALKNRNVSHPGRVKLIPVAGAANTYTIERDEGMVIEAGTPLRTSELIEAIKDDLNGWTNKKIINNIDVDGSLNKKVNASEVITLGVNEEWMSNEWVNKLRSDDTSKYFKDFIMNTLSNVWVKLYEASNDKFDSDVIKSAENTPLIGSWMLPASAMYGYNPMRETRITLSGVVAGHLKDSSNDVEFILRSYNSDMSVENRQFTIPHTDSGILLSKLNYSLGYEFNEAGIKHSYKFTKSSNYAGTVSVTNDLRIIKVEQLLV